MSGRGWGAIGSYPFWVSLGSLKKRQVRFSNTAVQIFCPGSFGFAPAVWKRVCDSVRGGFKSDRGFENLSTMVAQMERQQRIRIQNFRWRATLCRFLSLSISGNFWLQKVTSSMDSDLGLDRQASTRSSENTTARSAASTVYVAISGEVPIPNG